MKKTTDENAAFREFLNSVWRTLGRQESHPHLDEMDLVSHHARAMECLPFDVTLLHHGERFGCGSFVASLEPASPLYLPNGLSSRARTPFPVGVRVFFPPPFGAPNQTGGSHRVLEVWGGHGGSSEGVDRTPAATQQQAFLPVDWKYGRRWTGQFQVVT